MKGKAQVVQLLNEILVAELTAINQYFLGARMCHHRGYHRLFEKLRAESIEEMKHAERLVERILYLEGLPNMQKLDKLQIADSAVAQLKADLQIERRAVERLNGGIKATRDLGDNGSADLLTSLLGAAEAHVEWLEAQLGLVEELGEENYLAQQVR